MERVTVGSGNIGVSRKPVRAGWYYGGREKEGRRGCLDGGLEMVEMGVLEWFDWSKLCTKIVYFEIRS